MYHYFVSYSFSGTPAINMGIGGIGSCGVKRNKPITHITDIEDICNALSTQNPNLGSFTIINYQLLREEPDAE